MNFLKRLWINNTSNKLNEMNNRTPQQGWQCPVCRTIYSPNTIMCVKCPGDAIEEAAPQPQIPDIAPPPIIKPIQTQPIIQQPIVQQPIAPPLEEETLNSKIARMKYIEQNFITQPIVQQEVVQPVEQQPVRSIIENIEFANQPQENIMHNFEPRIGIYGPEGELCKICGVHRSLHPKFLI